MTMGPTGERALIQIHPTRRCNLRCRHCYTSSGPEANDVLPPELLRAAAEEAAALGYGYLGVSGGEPLLYRPLPDVLEAAHDAGMRTAVTTNGMPLGRAAAARLAGLIDVLAISLDGTPASHVAMRGHPKAFSAMAANLDHVRTAGIPFGFIFTLTQHNLDELRWVLDFAEAEGAVMVQVHPLDQQGRATETMPAASPDSVELGMAVMAAEAEGTGRSVAVHVDAIWRDDLRAFPDRFLGSGIPGTTTLGEWVRPLVVEATGRVVPLAYGVDDRLALGNLHDAPLSELAGQWHAEQAPRFASLCARAFEALTRPVAPAVTYWYAATARLVEAFLDAEPTSVSVRPRAASVRS
ncbi:MAG: radical SAM protein [Acidimicrobiales bacterium]